MWLTNAKIKFFFSLLIINFSCICSALTQEELRDLGRNLKYETGVLTNFTEKPRVSVRFTNQSSIVIPSGQSNWHIYLHSTFPIRVVSPKGLTLRHLQGDLHQFDFEKDFFGLAKDKTLDVTLESEGPLTSYSDFFPRAFIVKDNLVPELIANTDTENISEFVAGFANSEQKLRSKNDKVSLETAATRYQKNQTATSSVNPLESQRRIVPTPKQIEIQGGAFVLDNRWKILADQFFASEAEYLTKELQKIGLHIDAVNNESNAKSESESQFRISIIQSERKTAPTKLEKEAYQLTLDKNKIVIKAQNPEGAFYGIQSLLSLMPATKSSAIKLPELMVSDEPRYAWRGMHYDFARNFHGKDAIKRLIDQMSRYKLNRLHLHLSDDEGWRLEINGLPELTGLGGQRCFDLSEKKCLLTQLGSGPHTSGTGQGFLTSADFIDILQYAQARYVDVIPEVDMPGHSRAAIKAMEARYSRLTAEGDRVAAAQYLLSDPQDKSRYASVQNYTDNAINPCMESTYQFVEKIVFELQSLYKQAGVPLNIFHIGGDEVGKGAWVASPICQNLMADPKANVKQLSDLKKYFLRRIDTIVNSKGISLAGWSDGVMQESNYIMDRTTFGVPHFYVNAWDDMWEGGTPDKAYRQANAGYEVILSSATHLYFDHPQSVNSSARGRYWATRVISAEKVFSFMPDNFYANADQTSFGEPIKDLQAFVGRVLAPLSKPDNIIGMQGQIWSETLRTQNQLEEMLYPRLICLAERAWHKAKWEEGIPNLELRKKDWQEFNRNLGEHELPKLAVQNINFFLAPPGVFIENNQLMANTEFAQAQIQISFDQGQHWEIIHSPYDLNAEKSAKVWLRTSMGQVTSEPVIFNFVKGSWVE